jgi:hypothetical protein
MTSTGPIPAKLVKTLPMQHSLLLEDQPLQMQRLILKDRSQQYHNMLTCIHDLGSTEREKLLEWMIQTDELIANLPSDPDADPDPFP